MNLIVMLADVRDAEIISPRLRAEDAAEILAASGLEPEAILPRCVENNRTWKAVVGSFSSPHYGDPVALFGVSSPNIPWLVATPEILNHQISFLKQAKNVLHLMHAIGGPFLHNYVDARNDVHLRWLAWMGFTIDCLIPEYGAAKLPFWHFYKKELSPLCAVPSELPSLASH